ncbi:response regulator [Parapedobacter sp. GCM10030251]|uniref:response regulator n=1 Tax=Parapedobacter sp. GCM10030251 TaxID=3273419 RepID=UPI00360F00E6
MPIQIAVADDHSAIRLGMKYVIHEWMPEAVVHFVENMPGLLRLLSAETIDMIVLDINIPGGNNFHMIQMIKDVRENVKILVLSAYEEDVYALRYIDAGADGYLQKDCDDGAIRDALNAIHTGKKYVSNEVKEHLLHDRLNSGAASHDNPIRLLTNRELEVCRLLIDGKGVGEIAKALFIHTSTVGTYKSKIFEKLRVTNVKALTDVFTIHHVDGR